MKLQPLPLQLFYPKAINEKVHYKVRWVKFKEKWNGLQYIGHEGKEVRMSGNFTTKAGAEGFVRDLLKHMKSFTGEFEIIEIK